MRPDAVAVFQRYAELGYAFLYVTARGQEITLTDGRTSTEATQDWLDLHGFPEGALYLAEGRGVGGDDAVAYKAGVIAQHQEGGQRMAYAYGNAETDILAFQEANIPDDVIWLVGELAGTMGVQPLPDDQAYTAHLADFLPTVPEAACE
jgi:hypothetical protein